MYVNCNVRGELTVAAARLRAQATSCVEANVRCRCCVLLLHLIIGHYVLKTLGRPRGHNANYQTQPESELWRGF